MKQYKLLNDDAFTALKEMESNSFDGIITDPPYASGGFTRAQRVRPTAQKYCDNEKYPNFEGEMQDQRAWKEWLYIILKEGRRITKEGGILAVFIDWRQLPALTDVIQWAGWQWRGVVVWDKKNARPQMGRFRQQSEYIVWASNGSLSTKRNVPVLPGVFSYAMPQKQKRYHQTQKPLELMEEIIKICEPGGKILDPFMGSGTTIEAAVNMGYEAVGIEMTREYYDVACNRLGK
jgi:site-specific DNA-methyltransferase (adenine-specific)